MKMRQLLIAVPMLLGTVTAANAEVNVSVGISLPGVSIGVNMPTYPQLVRVPGYPVYYDPRADSNYFFYDGLYWVYQGDNWYASSWYNGPWQVTEPDYVPLYVLRVPVRYYSQPPVYFRDWRADAPPRWGDHWGHEWEQRRSGWDRWDRRSVPVAAPLPTYQRQYSGSRYPRAIEQQHAIRSENYRYQPREPVTQQRFQQRTSAGGERAEQQRPQGRMPQQQGQQLRQDQQQDRMPQQRQDQRSQDRLPQQRHDQQSQDRPQQQRQDQQSQERLQQDRLPQQRAQQERPAPQQVQPVQAQSREQHAQPEAQERGRDNRAEPQGRGHENRPEPQGRGRDNRSGPQDRERNDKNDERGQDRR